MNDGVSSPSSTSPFSGGPTSWELVALLAGLMSMNALAIDVMLPALPAVGQALGLESPNRAQEVVLSFALGMGVGQLLFGPLTDRFGRKPILLASLLVYSALGGACVVAETFDELVTYRFLQGFASAGGRVICVAIVRDIFRGSEMARVMSLVMMTFMVVPILAPAIGEGVLWVSSWRAIFIFLAVSGVLMMVWCGLRLVETLEVGARRPLDPRSLGRAYREVLSNRLFGGYMLALGLSFGSLMAFLGSSEQLFAVYGHRDRFVLGFAGVAMAMAIANWANARLVQRFGPRRVGQTALVAFAVVQLGHVGALASGWDGFILVYTMLVLSFVCLSFTGANFNAVALEPMGHLAGTAAAVLGFASTTLAAGFGGLIGRRFDGTAWPFAVGFLVLGLGALGSVVYAERDALGNRRPL